MGIIDTHAHITCDELYPQANAILQRASDAGLERILCICLSVKEVKRAFALQKEYPFLDIAAGYHPGDLYELDESDWEAMEQLLQDERIIAVGEIGLDYHWDDVDRETQKQAMIRQIKWANQLQKPILIHMRDATKDTLELLKAYKQVNGIMHCFSGSMETARELIEMGMYLSVGGPLTFKNARGIPEVMAKCPPKRLFIETDCPYLTPHPHRGKRNEPMYITYTCAKLAEVLQWEESDLIAQMRDNYRKLFHK